VLQGKFQEAKAKFEGALAINPQMSLVYAGLAHVEQRLGKSDEAWHYMLIAIFIDSSNPEFHIIAGNIAYEQGRKEQAQVFL
jgi:Tfp pilus assembly protein PilF